MEAVGRDQCFVQVFSVWCAFHFIWILPNVILISIVRCVQLIGDEENSFVLRNAGDKLGGLGMRQI